MKLDGEPLPPNSHPTTFLGGVAYIVGGLLLALVASGIVRTAGLIG